VCCQSPAGRLNRVHRVQVLSRLAPCLALVGHVVAQHIAFTAACASCAGAASGAAHAQLTHAAVAADRGPHTGYVCELAVQLVVGLEGVLQAG
jgi:hypothetical protein